MKILITGTHFTPAEATIKELLNYQGTKLVYIGRKFTREGDKATSPESQILPNLGVKFQPIIAGRLQRLFTIYTIPSLLKIPIGFMQAFYFLLREQPDVVLSFGGYTSVPVVFWSWLLSIPIISHEQTLVSGLSSKLTGFFADKIALSFEPSKKNGRTVVTGNPLREEILNPKSSTADDELEKIINLSKNMKKPLILVIGGNQGSHILNEKIGEVLDKLLEDYFVIHQTGDSKFQDFEGLDEKKSSLKNSGRYLVRKWINSSDLGYILKNTDLAISRAGINTLLEFAYFSVPALVIPIPYLYQNEQGVNAKFFKELGLVNQLPQNRLSAENLLNEIKDMLRKLDEYKKSAENAKEVVIPDAAKRLVLETMILGNFK